MTLGLVTAGESHGPALVAILTGLPAGLRLDRDAIDADLKRRQQGYGRSPRQQLETDRVEVLAGLRHGATLGTPLALDGTQSRSQELVVGDEPLAPDGDPEGKGTKPVTLPRPGHADLAGVLKYGHDDVRNALERASAQAHRRARGGRLRRQVASRRARDRRRRARGRGRRRHGRRRHARGDRRSARPTATRWGESSRSSRPASHPVSARTPRRPTGSTRGSQRR